MIRDVRPGRQTDAAVQAFGLDPQLTGAPVAVPVGWAELETLEGANVFDTAAVIARLDEPDPWAGYETLRRSITKAVLKKLTR